MTGAYHDRRHPIPDGWQQTAELPGHHGLRYVWIEPVDNKDMTDDDSKPVQKDPINPDYYREGGIEVADFIAAKGLNFFEGSVVKYVARWRRKGGVKDLLKARWYINKLIEMHDET